MISVVHVVVAGEIGGAERMLVDLASRPEESGARHAIALMTPTDRLAALFRDAGIAVRDRGRVKEGPLPYLWRSFGPVDVRWLAQVLREEQADVAQLHTIGSHIVGTRAARRVGAKIVRTEHGSESYTDPSVWPFSVWALRHAHAIVTVSDHVRAIAVRKAPWAKDRVRVVLNGVDTERFTPTPLPNGPPTFAIVGRLEPLKGVDCAIDALRDVPSAHLLIVGGGSEEPALRVRVEKNGLGARVTFAGWVDDVREQLARAHFVLSSSRSEGLGIALLEGMAMGRAAVALPVGGIPEIVRPDETGWLAKDASPSALAAAMREAIENLGALSEKARAFVVANASALAMCRAYGEVYESVVSRPVRPDK